MSNKNYFSLEKLTFTVFSKAVKVSFVQSAGTDKGTECRVTNWSHYSQCAKEERISDPFHFRTRQPIDLRQFESAPECKRIRESPGHYLIDVALCNETLRGHNFEPIKCTLKEAAQSGKTLKWSACWDCVTKIVRLIKTVRSPTAQKGFRKSCSSLKKL